MEHHGDLLTALQRHTSAAAARYGALEAELVDPAERAELEQPAPVAQPLELTEDRDYGPE